MLRCLLPTQPLVPRDVMNSCTAYRLFEISGTESPECVATGPWPPGLPEAGVAKFFELRGRTRGARSRRPFGCPRAHGRKMTTRKVGSTCPLTARGAARRRRRWWWTLAGRARFDRGRATAGVATIDRTRRTLVEDTDSALAHARVVLQLARPTGDRLWDDSLSVVKTSGHPVRAGRFVKRILRTKSGKTHRTYLLLDFGCLTGRNTVTAW